MKLLSELQGLYSESISVLKSNEEIRTAREKRQRQELIDSQVETITEMLKVRASDGIIKTRIVNEGILPETIAYFERENIIVWVNSEVIVFQIPLAS